MNNILDKIKIEKELPVPRYYQLYEQLRKLITDKRLKEGDLLPSDNEMIKFLGLSLSTVRQAMDELVKRNLIVRENGRGSFVRAPDRPGLNASASYVALFVSDDISFREQTENFSFYTKLRNSLFRKFSENMWNIRQFYVRDEKNSSFDIGKHRDSAMTGAVFVGHFSNLKNNLKDCRKALGVPVVFVDSHIKEPDVYSVVGPDITGALSATEFLIKQNIRRIGFLGAPSPNYFLRLKGYLQALKKHNITPDKKIIWFDREKAADDIERMTGRPAGIFCSGEQLAVRLMSRLNYSGVKIPDEISVICYDDTELLDLAYPPVSCVSVDIDGMASKTCLALTGRIKSKFIEVPAKLVIRESTKKSPGAESGKG